MSKKKWLSILLVLCLAVGLSAGFGFAATKYPDHEVTIVVPWAPGGNADTGARLVAKYTEKYLRKPVVVVNRAGAAGVLATTEVSNAKPDGYTVLWGAVGLFTTQPHLSPVQYQLTDFEPLMGVLEGPLVLAVRAESPWSNAKELINDFKGSGKELKFGHPGAGGFPHLSQLDLFKSFKIKTAAVPFGGSALTLTALLGNNIDVTVDAISQLLPQVKAGKVRIIGIFEKNRNPEIPDVPTLAEQVGYKRFWNVYHMLLIPTGVPKDAKNVLQEAMVKAVEDPEFKKTAESAKLPIRFVEGSELSKRLKQDYKLMGKIIGEAGLTKK